jgi:hypothetical protein
MKTKVTIYRESNFSDMFRNYQIVLNGNIIGEVEINNSFTFEINEVANLYLKIDWCKSNEVVMKPNSKGEIDLIVKPQASGWKIILYLFYITIFRNKYLKLNIKN